MYSPYTRQLDEVAALGLLQYMSQDQLKPYVDSDAKVDEYIADNAQMKSIETEKLTLLASNRSIADYNLQREPKLRSARELLAETYKNAVQIQKLAESNRFKLEGLACARRAEDTLPILQTEAVKAEDDAENVAEKFLKREVDVDHFIDDFIAKKVVAHTRKVKAEKMQEMLLGMQNGSHVTQPVSNVNMQWQPYPSQMPPPRLLWLLKAVNYARKLFYASICDATYCAEPYEMLRRAPTEANTCYFIL